MFWEREREFLESLFWCVCASDERFQWQKCDRQVCVNKLLGFKAKRCEKWKQPVEEFWRNNICHLRVCTTEIAKRLKRIKNMFHFACVCTDPSGVYPTFQMFLFAKFLADRPTRAFQPSHDSASKSKITLSRSNYQMSPTWPKNGVLTTVSSARRRHITSTDNAKSPTRQFPMCWKTLSGTRVTRQYPFTWQRGQLGSVLWFLPRSRVASFFILWLLFFFVSSMLYHIINHTVPYNRPIRVKSRVRQSIAFLTIRSTENSWIRSKIRKACRCAHECVPTVRKYDKESTKGKFTGAEKLKIWKS